MRLTDRKTTALLFILLIAGLSLLLYPIVSDFINTSSASKAIMSYDEEVLKLEKQKYDEMWAEATEYNSSLIGRENEYLLSDEQQAQYNSLLDLTGTGIMGYIEIPNIRCSIPIYHGTAETILQIAIGHLDWSSLPTGGENTHCVLSGHRGLPSAKLFSDLDKIVEGDIFMLRILDEVLTYEVDKISIVEPQETSTLEIEQGKDYCTLVTCTPYGVNSHRLLVRGHRVENLKKYTITLVAEGQQIDPLIVAPVVAMPVLIVLFVRLMVPGKRKTYKDE